MIAQYKNMYSRLISILFLSLLISSCCRFSKYDCLEDNGELFPLHVEYDLSDSTIQVNEILAFSIKYSEFLTSYKQEDDQDGYFNFDIIWYNGNFRSNAN
ncbi:MAG: hypothetical protein ACI9O4_000642 [Chitinophagales bacterium]|jgi:hypothetical protein